ncbi:glycosyltransferase family 4 protein [Anaeromyxobacter sp. Fw109-5]|uniref:glycosyltransferase family 4 protein n=1 Tax=Anaeromyxobacter sp. (strain Fw109-5) TaxID=404589 RepID=UPI0000ED7D73|nr:glycosyltransferase family 4 protein [Anaeromyxobacter sp. Fw109-5]ABS25667.1 Phosphatidylinositol alpha-mannosyltransferase [Anaeromyxobacter sp. Fw109-5]
MRIGVVTEEYYPSLGGIPEHVHNFAREARRLGHTVKIVTSVMPDVAKGAPPPTEAQSSDVLRVGASRPLAQRGAVGRVTGGTGVGAALRDLFARERFDVVHVHAPLSPVLPLLAIHHATGPVVGTFHPGARPGLLFRLARGVLQRYVDRLDATIAVSRAALAPYGDRLGADVRMIPHGVDYDRLSRGRRLRRFDDGKLNVLWLGRVEPRNGLDCMIGAFHRAWRQIDARLIVVGDGPGLARARARLPRELEEDVVFVGRVQDERPDWYATADVFCAPSQAPSAGVTLLEAMAAGKPVLASDVEGYREIVQHGREGEILPATDEAAWARALLRLAREPARGAAYGERGRVTAQRFAWPSVAREVLGVYRAIGVRG